MKESIMLKPQPRVTELNRPFWEGCNDDRLVIQKCGACAHSVFYPRVCCPFCKTDHLDWVEASGRGKVISHTTVRRTHHDSFNAEVPYVFAAIELEEARASTLNCSTRLSMVRRSLDEASTLPLSSMGRTRKSLHFVSRDSAAQANQNSYSYPSK